MLFSRFHQLHSFNNFLFKFFNLSCKLFFWLSFSLAPIWIVLAVNKRIINVIHHEIEDSDRIRSNLTIKNFLIACDTGINFLLVLREIPHEPYCFLFNLFRVSISDENPRVNDIMVIIRSSIRSLIIHQYSCGPFTIQKQINFILVGLVYKSFLTLL